MLTVVRHITDGRHTDVLLKGRDGAYYLAFEQNSGGYGLFRACGKSGLRLSFSAMIDRTWPSLQELIDANLL